MVLARVGRGAKANAHQHGHHALEIKLTVKEQARQHRIGNSKGGDFGGGGHPFHHAGRLAGRFRQAAANAMAAGFDGVEIHGANGYLIEQFLNPNVNQRTDAYGGSIENRTRFLKEVMQAVCGAIGARRCGIRISPVTPANDASDASPQALFEHVAAFLGYLDLAYVHTIEGATGAARDYQQGELAFDYTAYKAAYQSAGGKGAWMLNNGYERELADHALQADADLIAFGKAFIANPDLATRLKQNGPYNIPDRSTFYGGTTAGYTDYPALT